MFNLIAKAKEAGYQFWISASKVLTVTTGTKVGLNIVKTVADINPCLLVVELMNLGITLCKLIYRRCREWRTPLPRK